MYDDATLEQNVPSLLHQIKVAIMDDAVQVDSTAGPESEDVDPESVRNELERLREEGTPALNTDRNGPCKLPAHVMELPRGLQVYDEMEELLSLLTSTESKRRIGFTGM